MEHRFPLSWKGIDGNGRTKESSVNLRGRKQELGRVGRSFRCRVRTYETRTHLRSTAYGINPENSNFRRGELFRHDAYSRVVGRVDETLLTSSFLYADISRRFPRLRGRATCDYATQSGKLFTDVDAIASLRFKLRVSDVDPFFRRSLDRSFLRQREKNSRSRVVSSIDFFFDALKSLRFLFLSLSRLRERGENIRSRNGIDPMPRDPFSSMRRWKIVRPVSLHRLRVAM